MQGIDSGTWRVELGRFVLGGRFESLTLSRLSLIALVGIGGELVLLVALDILPTGHDPMVNFISEHVLGDRPWLATAASLFGLIGVVALLAALNATGVVPVRSFAGALIVVHILALLILMIFPVDPIEQAFAGGDGPNFSTTGLIHAISGMVASVSMMAAMIVVTVRLARSGRLVSGYRILILLCVVAPIGYLAMMATQPGTYPAGFYQRIFFVAVLGWLLTIALALRTRQLGSSVQTSQESG